MARIVQYLALLAIMAVVARADIYMHHPRGSNNRNCETNTNRNNANRLFNSQNNNAGGYPCPRDHIKSIFAGSTPVMYYYQGSTLPIQWASQHSCGYGNNDCQIIIQFACNDTLQSNVRDGTPTLTDPATNTVNAATYYATNVGVHESLPYYNKCNTRSRNQGLYTADQNMGTNAQSTRQNSNQGNTYGFECQEERDYYPYWHPTPWRDIAVFTSQPGNCSYYQAQSQNVMSKGECFVKTTGVPSQYNTPQTCNANGGVWNVQPAWGIDPPQCFDVSGITVRDNHLGNVGSTGQLATFNWQVPSYIANEQCILRIRYNITTLDTPWYTDSNSNGGNSLITQDPFMDWGHGFPLQLAFNTNQGGRTFQDRSYVFAIRRRPPTLPSGANIYNVGVRGKRGNIVDVFPSTEYDFVPNNLQVYGSDYVHFQWTGSDYNVANDANDANGGPQYPDNSGNNPGARSDRTNLVQLDKQALSVPRRAQYNTLFMNSAGTADTATIYQFALLGQPVNNTDATKTCLTPTQIATLTGQTTVQTNTVKYYPQNCGFLNAASVYYDAGPIQLKASGLFHYFCTRNNAFSNRSQKGMIAVVGGIFSGASSLVPSTSVIALVSIAITLIVQMF